MGSIEQAEQYLATLNQRYVVVNPGAGRALAKRTGIVVAWNAGNGWVSEAMPHRGRVIVRTYRIDDPNHCILGR